MDFVVKIKKLDARFSGYPDFSHRASIRPVDLYNTHPIEERIRMFQEFRSWCIDAFGMSCERDDYLQMLPKHRNEHWVWHYDKETYSRYFYFTEKGIEWVKLKWT